MKIGILGATGAVGRQMLECIEERNIDAEVHLFASERSAGKTLKYKGNDIVMINADVEADSLKGLRYIEALDPITVKDYYENYNLWRRIPLWLKL